MKVTLSFGDTARTARITRRGDAIEVTFDDGVEAIVRAERTADGGYVLRTADRSRRALVHADGDTRHLWIDGMNVAYRRIEAGAVRERHGSDSLAATIPAVVLDVLVNPGEAVEEGQTLVLLESMKMVMPIVAPHAGTIAALHCAKGDFVTPGVPLLEVAAREAVGGGQGGGQTGGRGEGRGEGRGGG